MKWFKTWRKQVEDSKKDAEADGVEIPTTVDEYCKTKQRSSPPSNEYSFDEDDFYDDCNSDDSEDGVNDDHDDMWFLDIFLFQLWTYLFFVFIFFLIFLSSLAVKELQSRIFMFIIIKRICITITKLEAFCSMFFPEECYEYSKLL